MISKEQALANYEKAMDAYGVPNEPLEVYTSCSWRRVGLKNDYKTVMHPTVEHDGHPDISGGAVLEALVAAFNVMLALRASWAKQKSDASAAFLLSRDRIFAKLRAQLKLDASYIEGRGHWPQRVELSGDEWVELLQPGLRKVARCGVSVALQDAALQFLLKDQQARLDALMLEFCPDRMTAEQKAERAKHQRPVQQGSTTRRSGMPTRKDVSPKGKARLKRQAK